MASITLTYAVKLKPNVMEAMLLDNTCRMFLEACDRVSQWCRRHHTLSQKKIRKAMYLKLRSEQHLGAQMAQSVISRVICNYRSIRTNQGSPWATRSAPCYTSMGYDLVWNKDYSITRKGLLSISTLGGRQKIGVDWTGMPDEYRTGKFGTARLISRNNRWLLIIPVTITIPDTPLLKKVAGVDLGMRFLAAVYDGDGRTTFYSGKEVTQRRAHYQALRTELQQRGTRSARRRLKSIGNRENRWMRDVNHQVSKALVGQFDKPTLIVMEDLKGIRHAAERVGKKRRYVQVSWAYYQLRQMIEYKAKKAGHSTILVDPSYTSQTCPKCGMIRKANRKHDRHMYVCAGCGYRSNDDRVGAMNIQRLGYEIFVESQLNMF